MTVTFKFKGVDETLRMFDRLGEFVRGEVLASSLMSGAQVILEDAQVKVPVRTGRLQRSLEAQYGDSAGNKATVDVGSDVLYAPFVEFGTSRMRANPFLRRAFDETKNRAVEEILQSFRSQVTAEINAGGLAR